MQVDEPRQLLVRTAVLLLGCAALAAGVELLALQAPGSPLYLGVLPGPLGHLRELSTTLALLLLGAEVLAARAYGAGLPRTLGRVLCGCAGLAVLAQGYGAANGMYTLQVKDLRSDALPLFVLKHGALLGFVIGYGVLGARAFRGAARRQS